MKKFYATYCSPYGTVAYKFDTDKERREFIAENGDFASVPTKREMGEIKRGEMVIWN